MKYLLDCCDKPNINTVQDVVTLDIEIYCWNCKASICGGYPEQGLDRVVRWNDMIMERDRKKREIVEVEINEYPFVFAMR